MPERSIIWGPDEATADYATSVDTNDNDEARLLETADGTTVLLEYDGTNSQWVYGGAVDMDGNDITNVGSLDTVDQTITGDYYRENRGVNLSLDGNQSISSNTQTPLDWTQIRDDFEEWDATNQEFSPYDDGLYMFQINTLHTGLSDNDWVMSTLFQNGSVKESSKSTSSGGAGVVTSLTTFNWSLASDTFQLGGNAQNGSTVDSSGQFTKAFIIRIG